MTIYDMNQVVKIDQSRCYVVASNTDSLGNIVSRVLADCGDVRVQVQGEGDHSQTRRARARAYVRLVLGGEWDVLDYHGYVAPTHVSRKGDSYGSLHTYGAVKVG